MCVDYDCSESEDIKLLIFPNICLLFIILYYFTVISIYFYVAPNVGCIQNCSDILCYFKEFRDSRDESFCTLLHEYMWNTDNFFLLLFYHLISS